MKLTAEACYLFTGGHQHLLDVRGDRDMQGTSVHGDGLWLRKYGFQLISLCVNLHRMLVKFKILCSNTSKDLVKLPVAVRLADKVKLVME